ncbi:hypothetical protein EJ08DRAFT_648430 [Tothia fuscella]|uniref:Uncharacterized protein n=1 Tax=Tothia fuscella TaxID=1048955 RepID=A0A9P4NVM2_9PEZI|nr:hypothetical protein EJ08DRAFT_648430 [Tothia fuscella]
MQSPKGLERQAKKEGNPAAYRLSVGYAIKKGIAKYVAPIIAPANAVTASSNLATPSNAPKGAIPHPEAILRASDPSLRTLIDEAEKKYKTWPHAALLELCLSRSYQLLKNSQGKLPSKSISALANWLAGWDVLKSPREKKWWEGDGIDLVNKAKARGYQGLSKKCDVISWLRSTPEEEEIEITLKVAEPTPNRKRDAEVDGRGQGVSKRGAKGTTRSRGTDWTWSEEDFKKGQG